MAIPTVSVSDDIKRRPLLVLLVLSASATNCADGGRFGLTSMIGSGVAALEDLVTLLCSGALDLLVEDNFTEL